MEKDDEDPDQANVAGMMGAFMQKLLKSKKRGRYKSTGFVAAQLYVNLVLFCGFVLLSLMTCWPFSSYYVPAYSQDFQVVGILAAA